MLLIIHNIITFACIIGFIVEYATFSQGILNLAGRQPQNLDAAGAPTIDSRLFYPLLRLLARGEDHLYNITVRATIYLMLLSVSHLSIILLDIVFLSSEEVKRGLILNIILLCVALYTDRLLRVFFYEIHKYYDQIMRDIGGVFQGHSPFPYVRNR
jgi:dolichol kinase